MKNITNANVPVAHEKSPTAGPNLQLRWDYANLNLYRSVIAYKCKKTAVYKHKLTASDTSKTAKITKK